MDTFCTRLPTLLAALAVMLYAVPPAAGHGTQPDLVSAYWYVGEEEVSCEVMIMPRLFDEWMEMKRKDLYAFTPEELVVARKAAEAFFAKHNPLKIDGIQVTPILKKLEPTQLQYEFNVLDYVQIELSYPTKARALPRQVSIVWDRFKVMNLELDGVHGKIEDEKKKVDVMFTTKEPQFVWHAPISARQAVQRDLPETRTPPDRSIPLVYAAFGALGVTLLILVGLRVLGCGRKVIWPVLVLGIASSGSLAGAGWHESHRSRFVMPNETEALATFESLQRNIYRAFDYKGEDDIYNALEQSVTGDLLDEVYVEVYQSLVMRDEGGATAQVDRVEIVETAVRFPSSSDAAQYRVSCRWRVHGKVVHWGHRHDRINEYQADYTLRHGASGWRIAAIDLLDQKRIETDDGKQDGSGD